ncbi:ABC transporter permease subunit [Hoyosella sp. G463]|uniref:ABC transporter permease subunit n=1 Tax=Lolliginicoccus lacisalsi TaxID=2742202 RepID=A0A927JCD2_9ACTN|nr:ABC transporter permease subunit [Lolliginicoccus lacisalsi]MBD8506724.1 ABC transporter permease subunit [Lolliginicoccus lacisalsi]
MTRLLHAELFRLRTTRTTWALLAGAVGLVGLVLYPPLANAGIGTYPSLGTPHSLETIIGAPRYAMYFTALLGVLAVSGEYRHRTITQTFLATPNRLRVVAAKLAAHGLAGLGFGVVATVAALGTAAAWHAAKGVPLDLWRADVLLSAVGLVAVSGLLAMIGVGVGALVPNQAAALVGVIVWLQIIESGLLTGFAPQLYGWTVNGAALAVAGIAPPSPVLPLLAPLQGGLLLSAYALVIALVATRVTLERDLA